jgi:predicted RNA binding protein YcfA (HicA-like mRNA interferase family)
MTRNQWGTHKGKKVYKALLKIGWELDRINGSHRVLKRGSETYIFAFADSDELGSKILSRIAKSTGLTPDDL